MLSALRPGNSFEIVLALFDISVDLLFIIELFKFLLLHLLLYELLLFRKCKLLIAARETECAMSIS